jgi:hypothetical protein
VKQPKYLVCPRGHVKIDLIKAKMYCCYKSYLLLIFFIGVGGAHHYMDYWLEDIYNFIKFRVVSL